ncbi:MAG: ATPase P [Desulfobacteraceae bacterium]|nr:MAG: ATPase P [Desulfobacteraceae bacterium]
MNNLNIPGFGKITINHAVFDFNGTLARDGRLLSGIADEINALSKTVTCHVITADTFGQVENALEGISTTLHIISEKEQARQKLAYIQALGAHHTLCAGNGSNDRLMLKAARIGIAVLGHEGLATGALMTADLVVKDIFDLFGLFHSQERLVATLRS